MNVYKKKLTVIDKNNAAERTHKVKVNELYQTLKTCQRNIISSFNLLQKNQEKKNILYVNSINFR